LIYILKLDELVFEEKITNAILLCLWCFH